VVWKPVYRDKTYQHPVVKYNDKIPVYRDKKPCSRQYDIIIWYTVFILVYRNKMVLVYRKIAYTEKIRYTEKKKILVYRKNQKKEKEKSQKNQKTGKLWFISICIGDLGCCSLAPGEKY